MGKTRVYDPKKVIVMWGGRAVTGFAEGSMVECEKNEENATHHVGAHGEVTQVINADNTGTITISLSGTSPSLQMFAEDAQSNAIKPLSIVDMNDGAVNAGGSEGWVVKTPNITKGSEIEDAEIEILVADYVVD